MKHKIKIRAFVLTFLLIFSLAIYIVPALPRLLHSGTSYTAYIYKDGELLKTIPLSGISGMHYYIVGAQNNNDNTPYNIIEYTNGCIRIAQANCPDLTCVNQGYIYHSLVPITCLPHHLVIELKADAVSADISEADMITY